MRLARRSRVAGLGLALAASLVLSACGGGGSSDDGVITVYGSKPQNPLIPTATNEVGGGDPLDNIFSGLVAYNTDGSVTNEVAESVTPNADSTVWTVTLKDGQVFSDKTPVTSESFVKAWNYGADPANKQLNAYFFYPIKGTTDEGTYADGADSISGLKVVNDKKFTITLKKAESDFNLRLGYSAYYPLPDSAYGSDGTITKAFGDRPTGNGPYKLTASGWDKSSQIALEPNPQYQGIHKAKNKGLTFKFFTSVEAAYTDVQSGNLDVLDQVPPSSLNTFEDDSSIKAYNEPGSNITTLTIPERLEHFSGKEGDLRRQALSHVIDRKQITEKIFYGARTPAVDFTSPVLDGWTDKVPGNDVLDTDVTEAKKLWQQADDIRPWTGTFTIAYNNDGAGNKDYTEAIANQVSNAFGIKANNKVYASLDQLRKVITDRSIETPFRTAWQADYPSMLNYLAPLYATGAGSNDGQYSNKRFDGLLADAAAAKGDQRYSLINQAQGLLMQDLPVLPLWYQNSTAATNPELKGFEFNWKGKPDYYKLTK